MRLLLETLRTGNWTFFGIPTAMVVSVIVIAFAVVVFAIRHRPGSGVERWGDPPAPDEDTYEADDEETVEVDDDEADDADDARRCRRRGGEPVDDVDGRSRRGRRRARGSRRRRRCRPTRTRDLIPHPTRVRRQAPPRRLPPRGADRRRPG